MVEHTFIIMEVLFLMMVKMIMMMTSMGNLRKFHKEIQKGQYHQQSCLKLSTRLPPNAVAALLFGQNSLFSTSPHQLTSTDAVASKQVLRQNSLFLFFT